ncbi:MAG: hypothetical protein ACLFWF_04750 [Alphaproteobacteria bacterium]
MLIYEDCRLSRKEVFIRSTQTRLPLTRDLIHAIWRQMLVYFFVSGVYWLRLAGRRRPKLTIGFYPSKPKPWYKIWNVTKYLGLKYSEDVTDCDILFYFEDKTYSRLATDYIGLPGKTTLNAWAHDIRKDKVARVFEEVFGYGLSVDPRRHRGPAVRKSVENGAHDGRVVICPIDEPEPGAVYQHLINNSYDGETVQDIRVPIIGERIPLVYIKERRIENRFANENTRCFLQRTDDALTDREQERLFLMARRMGVDFGGFDVLRERSTGRIYVVDVNKTCMGPPVPLPFLDKVWAIHRLGQAFLELVEDRA